MRTRAARVRLAVLLFAVLAGQAARVARAEPLDDPGQPARIRVEPKNIRVGMLYQGTKLHVEGTAPAGYRLALLCAGQEGKVELKRKGKVWGVIWMNVGELAFERVPSLYLAYADRDGVRLDGHSLPAEMRLGLGYDGIEAQVLPLHAGEDVRRFFRDFVALKEHEQLYSFAKLQLPGDAVRSGTVALSADFWLPASVPSGDYEVRLLGYRGDGGALLASEKLTIERVGLAEFIASMAQRHGLLYGILSVLLAIATGFLTGVLFGLGSKKGH